MGGKRPGGDGGTHRFEAYLGRLYGYAFSLAREPEDAKSMVQPAAA